MFKTHLKKLKKIYPLHPMQFAELSAIIFYIRSTMNRTTKSVTIERENGVEVNFLPLRGLSRKPLHDEWVVSDYAKFLSFYCGLPYEKCFQMPNQLLSYTKDDRGKLLRFKLSDKDGKIS